jgi:protein TonB
MRKLLMVLALGLGASSAVAAKEPEPGPCRVGHMKPMPKETRFYPQRAAASQVKGKAVVACTLSETGDLSGCRVVSETPKKFGFGDSAILMAERLFLMDTSEPRCKEMIGQEIEAPVTFKLD